MRRRTDPELTDAQLIDLVLTNARAGQTEETRRLPRCQRFTPMPSGLESLLDLGVTIPVALPPCVYILTNGTESVYVGASANVLGRIGAHWSGHGMKAREKVPSGSFDAIVCLPVPAEKLYQTEAALIHLLRPRYNSNIPVRPRGPGRRPKRLEQIRLRLGREEYATIFSAARLVKRAANAGSVARWARETLLRETAVVLARKK